VLDDFFSIGQEPVYQIFASAETPWEPLHRLKASIRDMLQERGTRVPADLPRDVIIEGDVYIEDGVVLEPGVYIGGPTLIFRGAEIRFGAYIRGDVIVAEKALVGHDTEVKHSILLPGAKAAHFAYVGDSILGAQVNLGAGTKLANVKVDMGKSSVKVKMNGVLHDSGLRKFGAILGDGVSLGCNSVTNPGTVMGKQCMAYALSSLAGYYAPHSLIKHKQNQQVVQRTSPQ
jgi:UDP-N-acetylglucosamine diphosphorylase / glucose-1-phosphate thymidylyltransferase / UDP-N-acetylgalactosamine diphosphorylase / glucosamine-1-phosphate N-acetyltransferase / galactosamine-1-phosphate N-acetyltransferase